MNSYFSYVASAHASNATDERHTAINVRPITYNGVDALAYYFYDIDGLPKSSTVNRPTTISSSLATNKARKRNAVEQKYEFPLIAS